MCTYRHTYWMQTYSNWSTPKTRKCKWLRVVIADVKFFLAISSCLMSLVISRTVCSDFSALALISLIRANSWHIATWVSSKAAAPSAETPLWLRMHDLISESKWWIFPWKSEITSSILDRDCSVGNRLLM